MATRAEQFRADEQRKHKGSKSTAKAAKAAKAVKRAPTADASQRTEHAPRKATPGQRPTRKSTRGSANRAKGDATLNLVESLVKGTPEARFRKADAQTMRVRGSKR